MAENNDNGYEIWIFVLDRAKEEKPIPPWATYFESFTGEIGSRAAIEPIVFRDKQAAMRAAKELSTSAIRI